MPSQETRSWLRGKDLCVAMAVSTYLKTLSGELLSGVFTASACCWYYISYYYCYRENGTPLVRGTTALFFPVTKIISLLRTDTWGDTLVWCCCTLKHTVLEQGALPNSSLLFVAALPIKWDSEQSIPVIRSSSDNPYRFSRSWALLCTTAGVSTASISSPQIIDEPVTRT